MEWLMVPNPWYIGNSAQNQKESSDQLRWPFGLENLTRISKKNKIGMSKSQNLSPLKYTSFLGPLKSMSPKNAHPLQNVSVKHMQTLLDLVKRSSVPNCHANGEFIDTI